MAAKEFLKAQWRDLLMLNYEVDPEVLAPYIPPETVLDEWQGKTLVSMVGFMFLDTKVLGIKWPFHVNFEEVNLRFYVKYFDGKEWKRGAVFISEIVPKHAIAFIANNLYKEHYRALPMRHSAIKTGDDFTEYAYEWKLNGTWNKLAGTVSAKFTDIQPGSAEAFIFEHYWGYNKLNATTTIEYQVEHIMWQVADVKDCVFNADITTLYGIKYLSAKPVSVFFARGSEICVRGGTKITTV
jgi:hypothetical protein